MRRTARTVLLALLVSAGTAGAWRWTWGPPRQLPLGPTGTASWSSQNSAWCVKGKGQTVYAAYTLFAFDNHAQTNRKLVYFTKSSDAGASWSTPVRLSEEWHPQDSLDDPGPDSADSPTIIMDKGPGSDTLVVAFVQYYEDGSIPSCGKVVAIASLNGGADWGRVYRRLSHGDQDINWWAERPSMAAYYKDGLLRLEVAWQRIEQDDSVHSVWSKGGVIADNESHLDFDLARRQAGQAAEVYDPSVAANACTSNVSFANNAGGDQNFLGGSWRGPEASNHWAHDTLGDENTSDPAHALLEANHPSSAFWTVPNATTHMEGIACEHASGVYQIRFLARARSENWADRIEHNQVIAADDRLPWYEFCRHPNLWYNNGFLHLVFTGRSCLNQGVRRPVVTYSADQGSTWSSELVVGNSGDSASIYLSGNNGYMLYTGTANGLHYAYFRKGLFCPYVETISAGCNSGRKLARQASNGMLHRVFATAGAVIYEKSDDNGQDWTFQDSPDYGSTPALALLSDGNPVIAYLRNDSVFTAFVNADSLWTIKTVFAGSANLKPGPPSLAVFQGTSGRLGNVVFPMYQSGGATASYILFAQFDTLGNVVLDTIDTYSDIYADSAPCLTAGTTDSLYCIFQRNDSVYCRSLIYSPSSGNRPDTWSDLGRLNGPNSTGKHPYVERFGPSRIWATYRDSSGGAMGSYITINRASRLVDNTGGWEGMASVSDASQTPKDWPVLSTGDVVVWSESTGSCWKLKAKVKDSLLTLTAAGDSNCKFGHVLADTSVADGPSTSDTKIKYLWSQHINGDTWSTNYATKSVKVSNADGNVTRYNNGCKLIHGPGDSLFNVYRTNAGAIYCAKKYDNPAAGWSTSTVASTGELPALAGDWQGWNWVADRSTSAKQIRYQYRKAGSTTWNDYLAYQCQSTSSDELGPPSIVAATNDPDDANLTCAYIAFPVYHPGGKPNISYIVMVKVDSSAVVYTDTLHTISKLTDSFPCLSVRDNSGEGYYLHLVYQEDGDIRYRKTTNTDKPSVTSKASWSDTFMLSGGSATARHPVVAAGSDSIRTAWADGATPVIKARNQAAGSSYNTWGSTFTVSNSPDTSCEYPTIGLGDSVIVAWHKFASPTDPPEVIACINYGTKLNISSSTEPSKYPHVVFEMHQDTPTVHTVWTEELSTNYSEVGYKRWQLGIQGGGGGGQSAARLDPSLQPRLLPAQPNPFNRRTTLKYTVNMAGLTRVSVYDATGRLVRRLTKTRLEPGTYTTTWDAKDNRNRPTPEGIYFVRFDSPNYRESRKLVLTQ